MTRWEAAALRRQGRRPRPGTGDATIDLRPSAPAAPPPPPPPPPVSASRTVTEPDPDPDPDPGTLLVPLDAWNRMLNQLGNLHEAGRDLADARERAARAETEVDFLRERLHDLRDRLEVAESVIDAPGFSTSPTELGPAVPDRADLGPSGLSSSGSGRRSFAGPAIVARNVRSSWRARRVPRR